MRRYRGLAVAFVSLAALTAPSVPREAATPNAGGASAEVHPIAFFDRRTFELAVVRAAAAEPRPPARLRGVVLPHHWLASDLIVGTMRDLAAATPVRRIVLLGPNHIGAGGAPFTSSERAWRTLDGVMQPDRAAISALHEHADVRIAAGVLSNEHSIAGLVPALARFFPRATLVPIALRSRPEPAELRRLAAVLTSLAEDPGTVLIASVDFSHYRSELEAMRRNTETIAAMETLDTTRVLGFGNEHLDSPASIAALMETMRGVGASRFDLWLSTSSASLGTRSTAPNVTSYVTGAYR